MNGPRVSVVIAAYNAEATLVETMATVAAQTYRDFELVVVDDGSDDSTPAILESHARRWPWMSWIRQDNAGVAAARGHGIALARGEFIAFLDADDLWLPEKLALQMAVFDRSPSTTLVYADEVDFVSDRDAPQTRFQQKLPARGRVLPQLLNGNFILNSAVVVRKTALTEVGGFDRTRPVHEGIDLWLRLAEHHDFDYVDKVLVRYRVRPDSLSHVNTQACQRVDIEIFEYWIVRRPDLFPEHSPQVRRRRAILYARMGLTHLASRSFSESRKAYRKAVGLGRRDPATLLRALAAHIPPLAYLFWLAKLAYKRLMGS